jgi:hypothetical protein
VTTARQEAEQELAYVVGKDGAGRLMDAAVAETFRLAADAMDAMSNEDGANLLRSMATAAGPTPDPDFPATWAGGHALVLEYGDEEMHGRCQCGQRFTPQRPDKPLDGFAGPWERHVMTLGR